MGSELPRYVEERSDPLNNTHNNVTVQIENTNKIKKLNNIK